MPTPDTLRLTLVRAPDDEASFSPGYQRELRQFYSLARAEGGKISAVTFTTDHADGGDGFVGEFLVPFTPVAGSTLTAATSAGELYALLNLTMAVTERHEKPAIDHV